MTVSTAIFAVVAIGHLLRAVYGWEVVIGEWIETAHELGRLIPAGWKNYEKHLGQLKGALGYEGQGKA